MAEETKREHDARVAAQNAENKGTVKRPTVSNTGRRPTTSNTVNRPSSSTVSRPTTSNTVTRPTASNTVTRPSSSTVTRPTTSNTVNRPTASNTVTRPSSSTVTRPTTGSAGRRPEYTGRVDVPIGKGQYINRVEDTTETTIRYYVKVLETGPSPAQVADLVLGTDWRERDSTPPSAGYGISGLENSKDDLLTMASKVIALGAKVDVGKYVRIDNPIPGLKKGSEVVDNGKVEIGYVMKVSSWGNSTSRVKELVLGNAAASNLQISLPIELEFKEREKDKMMTLAKQLMDIDADVSILKQTGITIPLQ